MNTIKKMLTIAVLAIATLVASAQSTVVATLAANAITNVLPFSVTLTDFTVAANAATAVTANLIDSQTNKLVYTAPGYTYYVKSPATNTIIYTNYYGVFETNVFVGLVTTTNTVATNLNAQATVVASGTAPASSAVTFNDVNYRFWNGITITNASAASMTVTLRFVR